MGKYMIRVVLRLNQANHGKQVTDLVTSCRMLKSAPRKRAGAMKCGKPISGILIFIVPKELARTWDINMRMNGMILKLHLGTNNES